MNIEDEPFVLRADITSEEIQEAIKIMKAPYPWELGEWAPGTPWWHKPIGFVFGVKEIDSYTIMLFSVLVASTVALLLGVHVIAG